MTTMKMFKIKAQLMACCIHLNCKSNFSLKD